MIYTDFIKHLRALETKHIRVLSFPSSCSESQLPENFSCLFPEILNILEQNISVLSPENKIIGLFSLQAAAGRISSSLRKKLHCQAPDYHLCYVLNYLILPFSASNKYQVSDWDKYQSLVIDFTSGEVMDIDRYLFLSGYYGTEGKIYGHLSANLLKKAWQLYTTNEEHIQNAKKCVNNRRR